MAKNKNKYKESTKFLNQLLSTKKSIFEMALWVRDHAQFFEWRCNYPTEKILPIIKPYLDVSNYLCANGMGENGDALREFQKFSVETVIKLEKCNCY